MMNMKDFKPVAVSTGGERVMLAHKDADCTKNCPGLIVDKSDGQVYDIPDIHTHLKHGYWNPAPQDLNTHELMLKIGNK
jgi:hypothetical protein